MRWITFFSQTGSEIVNLTESLCIVPDVIITNKLSISDLKIYTLFSTKIYQLPKKPTLEDYIELFTYLNLEPNNSLITLHGYLHIIPAQLCHFNIYNLHPGLITLYPELKGIHPQKKAIILEHLYVGCVLHKVIEVVDSGEIIMSSYKKNTFVLKSNEQLLRNISLQLWIKFFKTFILPKTLVKTMHFSERL